MLCNSKYLRFIALASALLHLADSGVTGLSHHHGDSSCAHVHATGGHSHHGASCRRHHRPAEQAALAGSSEAQRESSNPSGHEHDCAACRHLCQPLLHVLVTLETVHADLVSEVACFREVRFALERLAIYQPRAPPGVSA